METCTVLICDDNPAIHSSLGSFLSADGIAVRAAHTGEEALDLFRRGGIDLVVLDIMLPGMDGLDVCREIRRTSDAPILMLSARDEEMDRVLGLELGADDYVVKPFSPREVTVRIKKMLRRLRAPAEPRGLTLAELTVVPESCKAYIRGQEVDLTHKELEVLASMVAHAGEVLTREHLLNVAWGYDYFGDTRVVDALIKRIRQKIMAEGVHYAIRSVYGVGYVLEAQP